MLLLFFVLSESLEQRLPLPYPVNRNLSRTLTHWEVVSYHIRTSRRSGLWFCMWIVLSRLLTWFARTSGERRLQNRIAFETKARNIMNTIVISKEFELTVNKFTVVDLEDVSIHVVHHFSSGISLLILSLSWVVKSTIVLFLSPVSKKKTFYLDFFLVLKSSVHVLWYAFFSPLSSFFFVHSSFSFSPFSSFCSFSSFWFIFLHLCSWWLHFLFSLFFLLWRPFSAWFSCFPSCM